LALRIDDVDLQRDRRLVERFQEGDQTAFDTLYRRYFARLQRFCLKRVGDPHEAEEIAQEAFTRALRALPDLSGERRFYPWMTVIAGRLCVDHHRRRGRSEPAATIELGAVDGGQDAIVDQADFALLGRALERLAPRHREVLGFREERGWTYQQIAEHYEVPVGTVEALLFRARKALKREFLAIAGTNGQGGADRWAGLAAVPGLGWLVRRAAAVKARTAAAWSSMGGPVAAPVIGVVAVVGSVAVGVGVVSGGIDRSRPAAAIRPAVETAADANAGPRQAAAVQPAAVASRPEATSPSSGARVSDRMVSMPLPRPDAVERDGELIDLQSPDTARGRAEEDSIGADEEGTFVFVNPDAITDSAKRLVGIDED
jgi:RNA polymerase sigma-70 factor (ECF subfamily)